MTFVVVELDEKFGINTACEFPTQAAAEEYREDLAAAYIYEEGMDIRVIEVTEPLDRAGLKAIAANRKKVEA